MFSELHEENLKGKQPAPKWLGFIWDEGTEKIFCGKFFFLSLAHIFIQTDLKELKTYHNDER